MWWPATWGPAKNEGLEDSRWWQGSLPSKRLSWLAGKSPVFLIGDTSQKWLFFHCHVSFRGCKLSLIGGIKLDANAGSFGMICSHSRLFGLVIWLSLYDTAWWISGDDTHYLPLEACMKHCSMGNPEMWTDFTPIAACNTAYTNCFHRFHHHHHHHHHHHRGGPSRISTSKEHFSESKKSSSPVDQIAVFLSPSIHHHPRLKLVSNAIPLKTSAQKLTAGTWKYTLGKTETSRPKPTNFGALQPFVFFFPGM